MRRQKPDNANGIRLIPRTYYRFILLFLLLPLAMSVVMSPSFQPYPFVHQQDAYADGLTAENLPPATVGEREAGLFVLRCGGSA